MVALVLLYFELNKLRVHNTTINNTTHTTTTDEMSVEVKKSFFSVTPLLLQRAVLLQQKINNHSYYATNIALVLRPVTIIQVGHGVDIFYYTQLLLFQIFILLLSSVILVMCRRILISWHYKSSAS